MVRNRFGIGSAGRLRPELPPLYRKLGYLETGTEEFRPARSLKDGVDCHCIVISKKL